MGHRISEETCPRCGKIIEFEDLNEHWLESVIEQHVFCHVCNLFTLSLEYENGEVVKRTQIERKAYYGTK